MPVETFARFAAEQTVGIVVGVTAVVIAPVVAPRVVRAARNIKQRGGEMVQGTMSTLAVVAPPIKAAGETAYKQAIGGLHAYSATISNPSGWLYPGLVQKGNATMLCQFNFELPVDPHLLMDMATQAIFENGGSVDGELPEMTISVPTPLGLVDGVCKLISDSTINVVVTNKPDLVSCDLIRNKLVEYLTLGVKMHVQAAKKAKLEKELR